VSSVAPVQVSGLTNVEQLVAGSSNVCAKRTDRTFWCWGWNDDGQLGDNTYVDRHVPQQVPGINGVSQVALGHNHTCALKTDGAVWCWGANSKVCSAGVCMGQLGDGTTITRPTPGQVSGLAGVKQIAVSDEHACAVKTDNTV
jgi:alpha-tubulin suppressor-like RCC1 family protein